MKKLLAILMLTLSTLTMSAQAEATETAEDGKYPVYCELNTFGTWKGVQARLDIGNSKREYVLDDNGKKMEFNSTIAVLNYLAKRGWRVKTSYNEDDMHYLLYKMVSDDNEIYERLKTSKD